MFITNFIEIVKKEIYFQIKSKSFLVILFLVSFITVIHMFGLYNQVVNSYDMYLHTKEMYRDNNVDIVDALSEDNVYYMDRNSKVTNNPIKEDYLNLAIAIKNIEPLNAVSNTLEYFLFVFGTLIFGIYAAYVSSYDFKYRMFKVFSANYSQGQILFGKIGSIIGGMCASIAYMTFLAYLLSFVIKFFVENKIAVKEYIIPTMEYVHTNITIQIIFAVLLLTFYIMVGFSIGFIFKNMLPATLLFLIYTLFVPVMGAYDIKNIVSFFAHKIFNFKSRFIIFEATEISDAVGIAILLGIMIGLGIIVGIVSFRRSRYN